MTIAERIRRADDESHASVLAWQLGPETFMDHLVQKAERIRQRIEADYAATDNDRKPAAENDAVGDGEPSGGTGSPLAGAEGISTTDP